MTKYYVANVEQTKFAYLTTVPMWCADGGKTKLIYNAPKPHLFSLEHAKRVLAKTQKYNLIEYQLFTIKI